MLADPDVPREPLDELKYIPLSSGDTRTYLSFGANFRERFELNDANFGTGGNQQESYLLSRTEAHMDLRIHAQIQMFLQLQSDESPGKQRPSPVDQDRLSIEQGFVAVSEPLGDGVVAIRIGRQENGFDLQRFFSVRDGPNVRQSYDGVSVAYTRGPWRLITLYTHPVATRESVAAAAWISSGHRWALRARNTAFGSVAAPSREGGRVSEPERCLQPRLLVGRQG